MVRFSSVQVHKNTSKAFKYYQRLAKKGHTCETDDPYNAGWSCRKGSKLERLKKEEHRASRQEEKFLQIIKKIVSKMELEGFDQEKKEKVEDINMEPREIVDRQTLEFFLEIIKKYFYLM